MNAHRGSRPDQVEAAPQEAMSQADADTEAAKAPTMTDLWIQRGVIMGQSYQDDDNPELDKQQDEIEWAMVRTPSVWCNEVAYKLEVVRYWRDIEEPADRVDELLLESAIRDLHHL